MITHTTSATIPHSRYWYCQSGWLASVWLETSVTTRLPSTGPIVQNAIEVARLTWGEKSRISAGVATRHTPSTSASIEKKTVYSTWLDAPGSANRISSAVTSVPTTTRFARPTRSASPAASDANAPTALPITCTNTNPVNENPKCWMICVETAPCT